MIVPWLLPMIPQAKNSNTPAGSGKMMSSVVQAWISVSVRASEKDGSALDITSAPKAATATEWTRKNMTIPCSC
jgi:hypothetical protein